MLDDMMSRLKDAHAIGRLSEALVDLKKSRGLSHRAFKATGNSDEIIQGAKDAVNDDWIDLRDVARIVDEVEQNGRQHIILFRMKDAESAEKLADALEACYPGARDIEKSNPYALHPKPRFEFEQREGAAILRYTGTTQFWTIDEDESEESEDRIVTVKVKVKTRVVHLAKIHPTTGLLEIRIQNASSKAPKSHWQWGFELMLGVILEHISDDKLVPVPIWKGFRWQLQQKDQTYLATDEAFDSSTTQRISLRRAHGDDLRRHADYDLLDRKFSRETLNIYWILHDSDGEEYRVHAIQQKVELGEVKLAKIWVSRHVPEEILDKLLRNIVKPL